jgi:hypothetical protein
MFACRFGNGAAVKTELVRVDVGNDHESVALSEEIEISCGKITYYIG